MNAASPTYADAYAVLGEYALHSDGRVRVSCEAIAKLVPLKTAEVSWRQLAELLVSEGKLYAAPGNHICTMPDCGKEEL